ncbi:carbohydrate ABC transporter permease [Paenibacillus agricola]|uniref:Sugar ABC transporter permease n=1 Tax=Paenibacillus agricola TaxID=2716264 RepID=A0ABX0J7G9_9BACL|nr:sugar ABC transporter permease [Paenibacillus agricola]NHN32377.1 sugar ABC transporter permease [Paenibacillus agricola]
MDATVKRKKRLSKAHWFVISGLTPILLIYTYLRFIPILKTFYMSLFNWDLVSMDKPFIGFDNYIELFQSDMFLISLYNTTIIAFGILIFNVPLALLISNALVRRIKFKSWFEAIYFLPVITPMVPVTVVWKMILDSNSGLLNYFISFFGIAPKAWLLDPTLAIISVIMLTVWKTVGYNMLIFLVGLKGISKEYYEAAAIDGATGAKAFWHITLPIMKPITVFVSVITLIHGYNVFSQIYILASDVQGSPGYVVRVLVYDMIENGFRFFKMGYSSAEAVILFAIVFVLTLIQMGLAKEKTTSSKGMK